MRAIREHPRWFVLSMAFAVPVIGVVRFATNSAAATYLAGLFCIIVVAIVTARSIERRDPPPGRSQPAGRRLPRA